MTPPLRSWYNSTSEVTQIYAIVETGGKQFKVTPGQTIRVADLGKAEGDKVELDRVLLIADGASITAGTPVVEGARVLATSTGTGRDKKITVLKYKSKTRYRKKTGHHQAYTGLTIDEILAAGGTAEKPKRRRATKKEVTEDGS